MSKIYLRIDAVNLDNFVYDTHDISTIRGGSYLLLDSIESVAIKFKGQLEVVTSAASQGLFWFESSANPEEDSKQIRKKVLDHLKNKTGGHATFLVATQPDIHNDFKKVLEKLEAQIHWQQWHMPTVAIPEANVNAQKECYLDGWRPGIEKFGVDRNVTDAWISDATRFRRAEGARLRHQLFHRILKDVSYLGQISSADLGELSILPSKGILSGKIAFIHVDGNGFGSIRRDLCVEEPDRREFDQTIQDFRSGFLRQLLEWAKDDPDFQTKNTNGELALRLETLLWGGDEMTLVVPAWLGWKVIRLFFEMGKNLNFRGRSLSHRAAMIFCHHNAPILLIRQLTGDLLERAKKDIKAAAPSEQLSAGLDHLTGDALHYLVLESFDMLQGDLDQFLASYYKGVSYTDLLVPAIELDNLTAYIRDIQLRVARGKAIKIIKAIQKQDGSYAKEQSELTPKQNTSEDRVCLHNAIAELTAKNNSRWYLVSDLWDYLPE